MRRVGGLTSVCGLFVGMASASAQTEPAPPALRGHRARHHRHRDAARRGAQFDPAQPRRHALRFQPQRHRQHRRRARTRRSTRCCCARPAWCRTASARSMCAATTATCSTGSTACSCRKACRCSATPWRTRFANSLSLLTGALPAQYGLRTAGVVDIGVKSGTTDPGAEASMMGGSYNWLQPAFQLWRPHRHDRLLRRRPVRQQRHRHREPDVVLHADP